MGKAGCASRSSGGRNGNHGQEVRGAWLMPTLFQLEAWVKAEIGKGKGSLHTNHPVIMEEEQAARIANKPDGAGKQKTKIAWETNDPDCYSLFHKQRERYFKFAGGNPVLATE